MRSNLENLPEFLCQSSSLAIDMFRRVCILIGRVQFILALRISCGAEHFDYWQKAFREKSKVSKDANDSGANILRGGRLRKTAKGIASFAPFLASVSAVALGASLAGSLLAAAQTMSTAKCTSENSDGAYVCSGIQSSDADAPETITAASGQTLAVTQDAAFGLFVDASAHNGETAMTITAELGSSGGQVDFFTRIANTTRGGGDALKIVNNSGSDITFNNLISDSHGGTASEYILSALGDAVVLEGTGGSY